MPHYQRYTDAIKPVRVKKAIDYDPFTWNSFTKLLEDIKATDGYRTVVFDTAPMLYSSEPLYRDQPVFRQVKIPEEQRSKNGNSVD